MTTGINISEKKKKALVELKKMIDKQLSEMKYYPLNSLLTLSK